jgi:hypothetical protein
MLIDHRQREHFTQVFNQLLSNPQFEPGELAAMMRDKESLDPVIVGMGSQGAWRRRKQELELRAQSLNPRNVPNSAPLVMVEDVLLSKQDVIDALEYIHRVSSFQRPATV